MQTYQIVYLELSDSILASIQLREARDYHMPKYYCITIQVLRVDCGIVAIVKVIDFRDQMAILKAFEM